MKNNKTVLLAFLGLSTVALYPQSDLMEQGARTTGEGMFLAVCGLALGKLVNHQPWADDIYAHDSMCTKMTACVSDALFWLGSMSSLLGLGMMTTGALKIDKAWTFLRTEAYYFLIKHGLMKPQRSYWHIVHLRGVYAMQQYALHRPLSESSFSEFLKQLPYYM